MRTALSALAFVILVAINDALGACFFNSGVVLACLVGLALGVMLGYLVVRFNPDWSRASRLLLLFMLVSLLGGTLGLYQVLNYVSYHTADLDPSSDWTAVSAAGRSLFLIEALGLFLAYRHWTPRSRLPDLDEGEYEGN
ncbi:hypothetical protein JST97_19375 [bacterium]|nr:hypothetical protein [bacterium]